MEAWLADGSNDKISTSSFHRNNPSPPLVVGRQSQYTSGALGKGRSDFPELVSGFSDDKLPLEIHQPAVLKPCQKRRPSRGICHSIVIIISCNCYCLTHFNNNNNNVL